MQRLVRVVHREVAGETQERRRLLVVVRGRREDDLAAGARDREGEHPQLVAHDLGAFVGTSVACRGVPVDGVAELLGMQQRPAQPQIRPDALLQAGDGDDLEFRPIVALGVHTRTASAAVCAASVSSGTSAPSSSSTKTEAGRSG